jgi:hypothetical protein
MQLALAKAQEEDSVFRIKSTEDAYHALIDKETLEKVLQQGLKDEHNRYKDEIVEFLLNMKNRVKVNDLTLSMLNKTLSFLITETGNSTLLSMKKGSVTPDNIVVRLGPEYVVQNHWNVSLVFLSCERSFCWLFV